MVKKKTTKKKKKDNGNILEELGITQYNGYQKIPSTGAQRIVDSISSYNARDREQAIRTAEAGFEKETAKEIRQQYPEAFKTFNKRKPYYEELDIQRLDLPQKKRTAQEIVDDVSSPAVRKELRAAALNRAKRYIKVPQRVSPGVRRLDKKVSSVARKAIYLLAPKRSTIKRLTTPPKTKVPGRGRGRPPKTYKERYVPGVGIVKVPTDVYKKMLSQVKADRRLAEAKRQAGLQAQYEQRQIAAETVAMQQDPRFQQSSDDMFLDSPDMEHEQNVMLAQQQMELEKQMRSQQQRQSQGIVQRTGNVFSQFGRGLNNIGRSFQRSPQQYPPQFPQQVQVRGDPRVSAISDKSNLLNVGNIFNRPENVAVGFKRRY